MQARDETVAGSGEREFARAAAAEHSSANFAKLQPGTIHIKKWPPCVIKTTAKEHNEHGSRINMLSKPLSGNLFGRMKKNVALFL